MQDILIICGCITFGMLVGAWQKRSPHVLCVADKAAMYAVFLLLFVLGSRLGADHSLLAQLPVLGGRALCIAFLCTLGSVACLVLIQRHFPAPPRNRESATGSSGPSPLKGSVRILVCFTAGILLGFSPMMPVWMNDRGLASYMLYLLVFSVGIGLGADLRAFRIVRDLHVRILAVPLLIVTGSALGAALAACILPGISLADALSVGFGLGYYSLSSVLIENAGNPALASVALLSNILREVMAILGAPLLAGYCGRLSTIGAAGATAMDTTLPIIARFSGEHCAVIAVFSGMTLTLLVPLLVTAALHMN